VHCRRGVRQLHRESHHRRLLVAEHRQILREHARHQFLCGCLRQAFLRDQQPLQAGGVVPGSVWQLVDTTGVTVDYGVKNVTTILS